MVTTSGKHVTFTHLAGEDLRAFGAAVARDVLAAIVADAATGMMEIRAAPFLDLPGVQCLTLDLHGGRYLVVFTATETTLVIADVFRLEQLEASLLQKLMGKVPRRRPRKS